MGIGAKKTLQRLLLSNSLWGVTLIFSNSNVANAEMKLLGFGNVTYSAVDATTTYNSDVPVYSAANTPIGEGASGQSNPMTYDGTPIKSKYNGFNLGTFDILWSNTVGEKGSVFVETAIDFGIDNSPGIDTERYFFKYQLLPDLSVSVGRTHTALGYWNDTYHHGNWLHLTVLRPMIYLFEDEGGLLPSHNVGLEFRATLGAGFFFLANIGNGRGVTPDPPSANHAAQNNKNYNGLLWYSPSTGVRMGTGYYYGVIPATFGRNLPNRTLNPDMISYQPDTANNIPSGVERIWGAHFVYQKHSVDWISEYHNMYHHYDYDSVTETKTTSFYSQLGYQINDASTPYVRWEDIKGDPDNTDPYLGDRDTQGMIHKVSTVGVRYDLNDSASWKNEVGTDDRVDVNGEMLRKFVRSDISFNF